ncbi:hypothetical protein HMPREF2656_05350 [Corynebacterium sp. HMSC034B08]|uniref:MAE_28990/MAE_18760 family HEPN-like nuclease n=1 Tax=Corynebacterium sp. HMSC034B08 TaxID=1715135 RepID=UPI0008A89568|nr:MAE_28990/MAE_18760 family HEPN-like nuclease [Corynebacterium sp. HMSC034B08]OHO33222.1 hypothetical protein HMPREF2656_05350 [Corynebacterium sp. HMSC034B08]
MPRDLEWLENKIARETGWRKKEMTTALILVKQSKGEILNYAKRVAFVALYAHWEGWIKHVGKLYINFIDAQKLPTSELDPAFAGAVMKSKIDSVFVAESTRPHAEIAAFVRESWSIYNPLSESIVDTEANLGTTVLGKIVHGLNLGEYYDYSLKIQMIDQQLVKRRHTIAHGEWDVPDDSLFEQVYQDILALLDDFSDAIIEAARNKAYLAPLEVSA